MSDWKKFLSAATNVEDQFDQLKYQLSNRLGLNNPLMIQPYIGYGTAELVTIKGRVLENKGITKATDNDSVWRNMLNMYRQVESDEVPNAVVEGKLGGLTQTAVSDDEGFFTLTFTKLTLPQSSTGWHDVPLNLLNAPVEMSKPVSTTGRVMVSERSAVYGIISDIDDTVLQSSATNYLEAAQLLFLHNAHTRLPFPGVADFYHALHEGVGNQQNPIFYVSSSPWNVYTLLTHFFELNNLPAGPLFLKDYGLSREQLFSSGHTKHKIAQIDTILNRYPHLPFILIGDSGQKDPEIYAKIVEQYPNRIRAIYIRDVTEDERDQEVLRLIDKVEKMGVPMLLTAVSHTAAQHAAQIGLINPK